MSRLHITDDGRILPCSAGIEPCKYAKEETPENPRHFDTNDRAAAEKQLEIIMKKEHGDFPEANKKLKERKKSENDFEHSLRIKEIDAGLLNDRFSRTPNPAEMIASDGFSNFRNLLASSSQ